MKNQNIPYKKTFNEEGKINDVFPYISGKSQRRILRGSERVSINNLGEVSIQRRVKSAKRREDWV